MKIFSLTVLLGTAGLLLALTTQTILNTSNQKTHYPKFGLNLGRNFYKVAGCANNFHSELKNGALLGGSLSTSGKKRLGLRIEIPFSKIIHTSLNDGLRDGASTYIHILRLATFTIGKFIKLQAWGQIRHFIKTHSDKVYTPNFKCELMKFMRRIEYGFTESAEVYPIIGLLFGAKYGVRFGNI